MVPDSKIFVVFYLLASLIQVRMTIAVSEQHSVVGQPARFVLVGEGGGSRTPILQESTCSGPRA